MQMETKGIPCRVLVVDDHGDTAESFRVILNLWGYDVRIAASGPDALSMTTDYRPSIVFLDLGLPGLNGYDVARALNQLPHRPFIAVVSGYGTQEDRRRSAEAGADIHFVKPADLMEVRQILEKIASDNLPCGISA
jgi:CheY-like chemotaxis protein